MADSKGTFSYQEPHQPVDMHPFPEFTTVFGDWEGKGFTVDTARMPDTQKSMLKKALKVS